MSVHMPIRMSVHMSITCLHACPYTCLYPRFVVDVPSAIASLCGRHNGWQDRAYIYTRVDAYVHTHAHTHVCAHAYTHVHTQCLARHCRYEHVHMSTHMCTRAWHKSTHTPMHTSANVSMPMFVRTPVYKCLCACLYTITRHRTQGTSLFTGMYTC